MGLVLLVLACIATFVAMTVRTRDHQLRSFSADTLHSWGAVTSGTGRQEPWRLVASSLVHVTVLHLIYNIGALTFLAFPLAGFTSITYAVFCFIACAIVGVRGSLYWNNRQGKRVTSVGASGGVCGLNAALIVFAAFRGDVELRKGLAILLAVTLVVGLLPSIDNVAHLLGACGGVVVGLLAFPFAYGASGIPRNPTVLQRFGAIDQIASGAIIVVIGCWLWRERNAARRWPSRLRTPRRDPSLPPWRRR